MTSKNAIRTLGPFLEALTPGRPFSHLNLTLVPLRGGRCGRINYLLSMDALKAGILAITEVSESGYVSELLAVNHGRQHLLLLDGEELVGAKQNRILNTSVLLPGESKTKIPVSCVEQGRWQQVSREFAAGSYSPTRLRARKSRDVSENYILSGAARSDQYNVWEEVASTVLASGTASPTMAMHDVVRNKKQSLSDYVEALKYPQDARGILAAIGGKFVALDLFDKPATLEQIWQRLITGYAMDAVVRQQKPANRQRFTAKGASALLKHVGQLECRAFPSVGVGLDWRFEAQDILGQALVAHNDCIHLCVFPNEPVLRPRRTELPIQPPSGRGHPRPM